MSEPAPERTPPAGGPPKRENVFTRKLGPLPMWGWVAIAAVLIIGYVLIAGRKKSSASKPSGGGSRTGGFGRSVLPPTIIHIPGRRRREGDKAEDQEIAAGKGDFHKGGAPDYIRGPGETLVIPGGRGRRGQPVMGHLVQFKVPATGQTPSLQEVADGLGTSPDAIVEESTGRGTPHGSLWTRYLQQHDWQAPLPHGTDITVLARPQ